MARFYSIVVLDSDSYLLPGWEVILRDPKTETIIVDGTVFTGTEQKRILLELPDGLIRHPISRDELKQKICSAESCKKIYINDKAVSTEEAVNFIDNIEDDFIIMQKKPYTAVSIVNLTKITID